MPRKTVKEIPLRYPTGPVTWDALGSFMDALQREVLAQFDIRNTTAFPDAVVADPNTGDVTLGNQAKPSGRTVGVPTLTTKIGDDGREVNQTFRRQIGVGNISSVQSTQPLGASTGTGTATINVSAHDLHIGDQVVSYNAGSISGLSYGTRYWVYTDDADFDGGATTYIATTTPTDIADALTRYWVGVIDVPIEQSSATITDITQANPGVVTAVAHGFENGQQVEITGVVGMTEVNGNTYTVANKTADTFELSGTNTTGFTAYSSGGTATLQVSSSTGTGGGGGGGSLPGVVP